MNPEKTPKAIRKKICMLGAFAVGKTSLVRRFVEGYFDERYETTIGVKILKKQVVLGEDLHTLMIWDLHGDDEFQEVRPSYLRGASGYLLVVDGTRAGTLDVARRLHTRVLEHVGPVPFICLLNKSDLAAEWELDQGLSERLESQGWRTLNTSAATGEGVEQAFRDLAQAMEEDR